MDSNMEDKPNGGIADRIKMNPRRAAKKAAKPQPAIPFLASLEAQARAYNQREESPPFDPALEYIFLEGLPEHTDKEMKDKIRRDALKNAAREPSAETTSERASTSIKVENQADFEPVQELRRSNRKRAAASAFDSKNGGESQDPKTSPKNPKKLKPSAPGNAKPEAASTRRFPMFHFYAEERAKGMPNYDDYTVWRPDQKCLLVEDEVYFLRPNADHNETGKIFDAPFKLHPERRPFILTEMEHKAMMKCIQEAKKKRAAADAKTEKEFSLSKAKVKRETEVGDGGVEEDVSDIEEASEAEEILENEDASEDGDVKEESNSEED